MEHLIRKNITVPLLRDRAYNTKLDTILKEDNEENKNNDAAKLKDNAFNTPTTLEKYINLTTIVEKGENR